MNRINATFTELKAQGKKALITYIVSGDPEPSATVDAMHNLVAAGADILELGVPFSDPMAEGPVIQRAHERALEAGTSLLSTLNSVATFREKNSHTPVVLMGYANPVERMGFDAFAKAAKEAGVDGLLTVDLPPEEAEVLDAQMRPLDIDNILLIAPTTADARVSDICAAARGFVYYVSMKGVTGASNLDATEVADKMAAIKRVADTPVVVGFGIKDAASAQAIGACSDGVVVGSALVKFMEQQDKEMAQINAEIYQLVQSMRVALDEL